MEIWVTYGSLDKGCSYLGGGGTVKGSDGRRLHGGGGLFRIITILSSLDRLSSSLLPAVVPDDLRKENNKVRK
jgi:hypothetical protein